MRKTAYTESAHTADTTHPPADSSPTNNGLPNRLMTAFEEGGSIPQTSSTGFVEEPQRECRNKEDPYGCSKTVSQQRL